MDSTDLSASADADTFDPYERERQLRQESESWDTSDPRDADDGDVEVIDLSDYFTNPTEDTLQAVAAKFRRALQESGFLAIVGHGISSAEMTAMFDTVRKFHALPLDVKKAVLMDKAD